MMAVALAAGAVTAYVVEFTVGAARVGWHVWRRHHRYG
jgi:hypothetical protein